MAVSPDLADTLRQTLDLLQRAPGPLVRKLRLLAEGEDLSLHDEDVPPLLDLLLAEDANEPLRLAFHQRLADWDHVDGAAWTADTGPHTPERRARIHQLLDWSAERIARCDALFPVVTLKLPTIIAEKHEPWYTPERRIRSFYWSSYARYLETGAPRWKRESVQQLEVDATSVVSRLSDPERSEAFAARGLVVGYVQSGKTANFTAVIAKAADAGYRLVIVLTGMLDILRAQTQRRIDKELVGWEMCDGDQGDYKDDGDRDEFVRHGGPPSARNLFDWYRLTDANNDYRELRRGVSALHFGKRDPSKPLFHPENLHGNAARIIVVKKNKQVLVKLAKDLAVFKSELVEVPALVIDDESDQASPSTSRPGKPPTAINKCIRDILEILPRGQYVGYTATPFANVFINPHEHSDLFPRDFVISLQRPTGYMGLREFFDIDIDDIDAPPTTPSPLVHPVKGEDKDEANLLKALDIFFLTGALKLYRQAATRDAPEPLRFRHHTMLVHCSQQQKAHVADREKVRSELAKAGWDKQRGLLRLKKLWEREIRPVSLARGAGLPLPKDFDELLPYLNDCHGRLYQQIGTQEDPVLIVNGDEREATTPNFEKESVWKVLVGGNKLSRGYTVEGLTVSYYRRPARTADTLMQMGRWFGFRRGFSDLVRLFVGVAEPGDRNGTTVNLIDSFVDTCILEEEFRRDLQKYAEPPGSVLPIDLYPLVRAVLKREKRLDPKTKDISLSDVSMLPTAAAKMRHTEIVGRNFGGDKFERTQAPTDERAVVHNSRALQQLMSGLKFQSLALNLKVRISASKAGDERELRDTLWHARASTDAVLGFLRAYRWYDDKPLASDVVEYLKLPASQTGLEGWQVITFAKAESKGKAWETGVASPRELPVIHRSRPTPNRFGVYQEPQQTVLAEYLAGWTEAAGQIKGGLTRGIEGLRDKKSGVIVVYLVRDPESGSNLVHVGFILRFPENDSATRFFFRPRGQKDE